MPDTRSIKRLSRLSFLPPASSLGAPSANPPTRLTASNTSATWLPTTTWNWPPLSTTMMTPGFFFSAAALARLSSRSLNRRRVAQCTKLFTLSRPPTPAKISLANVSYFIRLSLDFAFCRSPPRTGLAPGRNAAQKKT